MGLFATAEPGSLLKSQKDVKPFEPPKKEYGASKSKKSDVKGDAKDKGGSAAEAEKPEEPAD